MPKVPSSFGFARFAMTERRFECASPRVSHLCEKCSALSCWENSDAMYLVSWEVAVKLSARYRESAFKYATGICCFRGSTSMW